MPSTPRGEIRHGTVRNRSNPWCVHMPVSRVGLSSPYVCQKVVGSGIRSWRISTLAVTLPGYLPHPRAAAGVLCLGGQVRNRCSLCTLPHSHAIPGTACGRVGAVLAQDWRSARRSSTPCALRMHRKAGTTSHGWEMGTSARFRPAALAGRHLFQI